MAVYEQKRFWQQVEIVREGSSYGIALDGRPVKTPLKRPLLVPSEALVAQIADEWRAVENKVDFHKMPYTRFAHAALDQAVDERVEIAAKIALYGETDLLCYRAETPQELADRQKAAWGPLLDWSARELAAPLRATAGIVHIPQPPESLQNLTRQVQAFTGFGLTALYDWVTISGSLILGLAVATGRLSAAEAWALSHLDETWQEEQWGIDDEARELAESKRATFLLVERALGLI